MQFLLNSIGKSDTHFWLKNTSLDDARFKCEQIRILNDNYNYPW